MLYIVGEVFIILSGTLNLSPPQLHSLLLLPLSHHPVVQHSQFLMLDSLDVGDDLGVRPGGDARRRALVQVFVNQGGKFASHLLEDVDAVAIM